LPITNLAKRLAATRLAGVSAPSGLMAANGGEFDRRRISKELAGIVNP